MLLIAIVAGLLIYLSQRPKESEQPVVNGKDEIDTSGWQVYRNEEYGYELRYPKNWAIEDSTTFSFRIKNDGSYFWLSMPPLGFGYNRQDAKISKIIIDDNIEAEKLEFTDTIIVNFKKDDTDGLIRFKYDTERKSYFINLFEQIINNIRFRN